ncbi:hypothetical protein [Pontibacter chitinilyticus]|uniref:hypothetical protein n=1 Tax=Pontibacter chitinilyticus TaxID=2674989 RepID=UPI00321BD67B
MKVLVHILIACLLVWSSGCVKETEAPVPDSDAPCELTEVRANVGQYNEKIVLQVLAYNQAHQPLRYKVYNPIDQTYNTLTLRYDAQGRTEEVLSAYSRSDEQQKAVYTYNSAGLPDSVSIYTLLPTSGMKLIATFPHTYNSQHQLVQVRLRELLKGTLQDYEVMEYEYQNGVLHHVVEYAVNSPVNTFSSQLTFDAHKLPAAGISVPFNQGDFFKLLSFLFPYQHNLTSLVVENSLMTTPIAERSFDSRYTYNAQGYPLTQTRTYHNGKEVRYTFAYHCP